MQRGQDSGRGQRGHIYGLREVSLGSVGTAYGPGHFREEQAPRLGTLEPHQSKGNSTGPAPPQILTFPASFALAMHSCTKLLSPGDAGRAPGQALPPAATPSTAQEQEKDHRQQEQVLIQHQLGKHGGKGAQRGKGTCRRSHSLGRGEGWIPGAGTSLLHLSRIRPQPCAQSPALSSRLLGGEGPTIQETPSSCPQLPPQPFPEPTSELLTLGLSYRSPGAQEPTHKPIRARAAGGWGRTSSLHPELH